MRNLFYLLLLSGGVLYSQWKPITTNTGLSLYSVQFFDAETGIISGANGLIMKSTDGGKNWIPYTEFINLFPDLYAVSLYKGTSGWISGRSGALLQSTNKGQTWTPKYGFASSIGGFYLSHATFVSDTVGWMLGNYNAIFRTKFGDGYWTVEYVSRDPLRFNYMYTKDCISGFLVGDNGAAARTSDRGFSWKILQTNVSAKLENVTFINDSVGWIVGGAGTILKTIDAGNSWAKYEHGKTDQYNWVTFVSDSIGWIVGINGIILKTTDAGAKWNTIPSGKETILRSIWFSNKDHGIIVGDNGTVLMYDTSFILGAEFQNDRSDNYLFDIDQNYPNPFNPTTQIIFTIPIDEMVTLKLFDVLGREVKTVVTRPFAAGPHTVEVDATGLSSGTYLYQIRAGKYIATKKMILLR